MSHEAKAIITLGCLANAIRDALQEMQRRPDDDIQDIFNKHLQSWQTDLRMNSDFSLDRKPL